MVKILGFGYGGAPKPLSFKSPGEYGPGAKPVGVIMVEYLNSPFRQLPYFKDGSIYICQASLPRWRYCSCLLIGLYKYAGK